MNEYIRVTEDSEEDIIEIPIEVDGVILLSTLSAQYPGVTGLKYKNNNTGTWRGIRLENGKLWPPDSNNWGNNLYYAVFPKDNKKGYEGGGGWYNNNCPTDNGSKFITGEDRKCCDLIILGLPWSADEGRLKDFFSKFGDLVFAQIKRDASGKSKGFGFIRFAEYEAQVNCLNQKHNIDGRICEVRVPHSKTGAVTLANAKIHVGRVTDDITTEDIHAYFSHYGKVVEVFVPKPCRGFAFVTFHDSEVAQRLIGEDLIIKNTSVRISPANAQPWEGRTPPAPFHPHPGGGAGSIPSHHHAAAALLPPFQTGGAGGLYIGNNVQPPHQQHHAPNGLGCGAGPNGATGQIGKYHHPHSMTAPPPPHLLTNNSYHHAAAQNGMAGPAYHLTAHGPSHFQYAHQHASGTPAAFGLAYGPPPHANMTTGHHLGSSGCSPNSGATSFYNPSGQPSPNDGAGSQPHGSSSSKFVLSPLYHHPTSPPHLMHSQHQHHQQQLSPLSHNFSQDSPTPSQHLGAPPHHHHLHNNGAGDGMGSNSAHPYAHSPNVIMGGGVGGYYGPTHVTKQHNAGAHYQQHSNGGDGPGSQHHFAGVANYGNGAGGVAAAANILAAQNFLGALVAAQQQQAAATSFADGQHHVMAAGVGHHHLQYLGGPNPVSAVCLNQPAALCLDNDDSITIHSDIGSTRLRNDSVLSSEDAAGATVAGGLDGEVGAQTGGATASANYDGEAQVQQQQQQFLFNMLAAAGGNSMAAAANLILLNSKIQQPPGVGGGQPLGAGQRTGSRYSSVNGGADLGEDLTTAAAIDGMASNPGDAVMEQIYAAAHHQNQRISKQAHGATDLPGGGSVKMDDPVGSSQLAPIPSSAWNDVVTETSVAIVNIEDTYYDLALTAAAAAINSSLASPTPLIAKTDHYATNGVSLHDSSSNIYSHHFGPTSKPSTPRLTLGQITSRGQVEQHGSALYEHGGGGAAAFEDLGATPLKPTAAPNNGQDDEGPDFTNLRLGDQPVHGPAETALYSRAVRSPLGTTHPKNPEGVAENLACPPNRFRPPSESFSGSIDSAGGSASAAYRTAVSKSAGDNRSPW